MEQGHLYFQIFAGTQDMSIRHSSSAFSSDGEIVAQSPPSGISDRGTYISATFWPFQKSKAPPSLASSEAVTSLHFPVAVP